MGGGSRAKYLMGDYSAGGKDPPLDKSQQDGASRGAR